MNTSIIIVGAGPVGATLALALAQVGFSVVIVEKNLLNNRVKDARTLVLNWASIQLFTLLGLEKQLYAHGQIIDTVVVRAAGSLTNCTFHADQHDIDCFGIAIPFSQLHGILLEKVSDDNNISLIQSYEAQSLTHGQNSITINGNASSKKMTISGQLLVAADGTYSSILEMANIRVTKYEYNKWANISEVNCKADLLTTAYEIFAGKQTYVLVPSEGVKATIIVLDDKKTDYGCDEINLAFMGLAPEVTSIHSIGSFALMYSQAEELSQPRLAIIGNSARTMYPLAAQGLNLAFSQIHLMVQLLQGVDDPGDCRVLQEFSNKAYTLGQTTSFAVHSLRKYIESPAPLACTIGFLATCLPLQKVIVNAASGKKNWWQNQHTKIAR